MELNGCSWTIVSPLTDWELVTTETHAPCLNPVRSDLTQTNLVRLVQYKHHHRWQTVRLKNPGFRPGSKSDRSNVNRPCGMILINYLTTRCVVKALTPDVASILGSVVIGPWNDLVAMSIGLRHRS